MKVNSILTLQKIISQGIQMKKKFNTFIVFPDCLWSAGNDTEGNYNNVV